MAKETLKDILKKVITRLEQREKEEQGFFKAWEKAVGEQAAEHTKLILVKNKRLIINVSDSAWLYTLAMEKTKIIEKLNLDTNNKKQIKEIQFRIGNIN